MTNDGFFPIQLSEGMNRSFYQNEKFASHWQEIKSPCPAGGVGGESARTDQGRPGCAGSARLKRILTIHHPGIKLIPMPVLTFKVTDGEARIIRARAHSAKAKSLSAFLRKSVLQESPARRKVVTKTHPVSGLPYDASPGPQVTDEEIRAALADFP